MNVKSSANPLLALLGGVICLSAGVGCVADSPDDPGFNKPAVASVVEGDVNSFDQYLDRVKEENERRLNTEGDVYSSPDGF